MSASPQVFRHTLRWQQRVAATSLKTWLQARTISTAHESVQAFKPNEDKLDLLLEQIAQGLHRHDHASIPDLYHQYQHEAGTVIDRVVPYDERPVVSKRAHMLHTAARTEPKEQGDGLVLVVHAQLDEAWTALTKTTVCSGFVVDASLRNSQQGDTIVTCAHTLEEVNRTSSRAICADGSCRFMVTPGGRPRQPEEILQRFLLSFHLRDSHE